MLIYIMNIINKSYKLILIILLIIFVLTILDFYLDRKLKEYHLYGERSNDTIVLIHGLNDDNRCWNKQINFLKKHYYLIVFNRTSTKKYMNEKKILNIINKNKTDKKLYCISASYGGVVAFKIQDKYNIFDKMIFMNLTWNPIYSFDYYNQGGFFIKYLYPYYIIVILNSIIPILNIYPLFFIQILIGLPFFILSNILDYIFYKRINYKDFYIGIYNTLTFTKTQRESQGNAYKLLLKELLNYKNTKEKHTNKLVLNFVGEYDNIGHFNSPYIKNILEKQNVQLEIIPNTGHWFMKTHSNLINKKIHQFFNSKGS